MIHPSNIKEKEFSAPLSVAIHKLAVIAEILSYYKLGNMFDLSEEFLFGVGDIAREVKEDLQEIYQVLYDDPSAQEA